MSKQLGDYFTAGHLLIGLYISFCVVTGAGPGLPTGKRAGTHVVHNMNTLKWTCVCIVNARNG